LGTLQGEARLALRLAGLAALVWVAWRLRMTLLVLLLSAALSALLAPVADRVSTWSRGRRELGAAAALGLLAGLLVLFARLILGPLGREVSRVLAAAPAYARLATEQLARLEAAWAPLPGDAGLVRLVVSAGRVAVERALGASLSMGAHAYVILLVPVLTFFFLKDAPVLAETAQRALPEGLWEPLRMAVAAAAFALRRSLVGLVCIALVTWVLLWVGLSALRVPNALGWSALAAVAETVPYLGPLFALVTVGTASFSRGAQTGWAVVVLLLAVRGVVDAVVAPLALRSLLRLHAVVVVCSILVGTELFGAVGALLAAPIATTVASFVRAAVRDSSVKLVPQHGADRRGGRSP
jgi:predicted PurR-regulated permease PerM